jgi:hypothetical protein
MKMSASVRTISILSDDLVDESPRREARTPLFTSFRSFTLSAEKAGGSPAGSESGEEGSMAFKGGDGGGW